MPHVLAVLIDQCPLTERMRKRRILGYLPSPAQLDLPPPLPLLIHFGRGSSGINIVFLINPLCLQGSLEAGGTWSVALEYVHFSSSDRYICIPFRVWKLVMTVCIAMHDYWLNHLNIELLCFAKRLIRFERYHSYYYLTPPSLPAPPNSRATRQEGQMGSKGNS